NGRFARHLQHELGQRGAKHAQPPVARRVESRAGLEADDRIVLHDPVVIVELLSLFEDDQVSPAAMVDEQRRVTGAQWSSIHTDWGPARYGGAVSSALSVSL